MSAIAKQIPPISSTDVVRYPPSPASQSLPQLSYNPQQSHDPRYTTLLRDLSGDWIQLDGMNPADNRFKPTTITERVPDIPFWPGTVAGASPYGSGDMGAIYQFASTWKPKPVDTRILQYAHGWNRLPHPAGVYVGYPYFGTSVALYWRTSLLPLTAGLPSNLENAVLKLTPLPLSAIDASYVGSYYRVPAAHVKPMKIAISQFPTPAASDQYNVVFVVDTGEEWRIPLDVVRTLYRSDVRIRAACNALIRDYPFLENMFAFVPSPLPAELQFAVAQYARQVGTYQQALGGTVRIVQRIPGAPANYPGAIELQQVPAAAAPKEEEKEEEKKEEVPETKEAKSVIDLSGCNRLQLRRWDL